MGWRLFIIINKMENTNDEEQTKNTEHITLNDFNWSLYNQSQTKEKIFFMRLLRELCDLIEQPPHDKGRKPVKTGDMIYSLALKTY